MPRPSPPRSQRPRTSLTPRPRTSRKRPLRTNPTRTSRKRRSPQGKCPRERSRRPGSKAGRALGLDSVGTCQGLSRSEGEARVAASRSSDAGARSAADCLEADQRHGTAAVSVHRWLEFRISGSCRGEVHPLHVRARRHHRAGWLANSHGARSQIADRTMGRTGRRHVAAVVPPAVYANCPTAVGIGRRIISIFCFPPHPALSHKWRASGGGVVEKLFFGRSLRLASTAENGSASETRELGWPEIDSGVIIRLGLSRCGGFCWPSAVP